MSDKTTEQLIAEAQAALAAQSPDDVQAFVAILVGEAFHTNVHMLRPPQAALDGRKITCCETAAMAREFLAGKRSLSPFDVVALCALVISAHPQHGPGQKAVRHDA